MSELFGKRKSERKRKWEQEQREQKGYVSYRGVPQELHERLKGVADKLGVPVGEVARAFLQFGLDAYERGDLELSPTPVQPKNTLFPEG